MNKKKIEILVKNLEEVLDEGRRDPGDPQYGCEYGLVLTRRLKKLLLISND